VCANDTEREREREGEDAAAAANTDNQQANESIDKQIRNKNEQYVMMLTNENTRR
jgi:hypothetical protein